MIDASNVPAIIAALTFAVAILAIALNGLDLAVAGLLGANLMLRSIQCLVLLDNGLMHLSTVHFSAMD